MLIQSYYPLVGGAERQLQNLIPLLLERNLDVHIITRHVPDCPPYEEIDGVPVYRLPVYSNRVVTSLAYTFNTLRQIQKIQPDMIHAYDLFSPTTTAIIAKLLFRVPVATKVLL